MKKALLTSIYQDEVKILSESDAPETYKNNLPPGGSAKWELIELADGKRFWQPKHSYTFNTPAITDHTKVKIQVAE